MFIPYFYTWWKYFMICTGDVTDVQSLAVTVLVTWLENTYHTAGSIDCTTFEIALIVINFF